MNDSGPLARINRNWSFAARRLHAARGSLPPVDWRRVGFSAAVAVAFVIIIGVLFDARIIEWTRTLPAPIEATFKWITRFGQSDWILIPSGLVVVLVLLGDWRRVSRANAAAWWEIGTFAAVLFAVVAITGLTTDTIKPIVGRFRPDYVSHGAFAFAPFSFGGYAHYSFPSGHATTMAAVGVMATFLPGVLTVPIVIAAGVVAISRVIIGVHFPSDVVGGVFVGLGVGYAILHWMRAAGIVFAIRGGQLRRRFGVTGKLRRNRDGHAGLFPALWVALSPFPQREQMRLPGPQSDPPDLLPPREAGSADPPPAI